MTFRIGQKVVCVDGRRNADWSRPWLSEGAIYTISSIGGTARDSAGLFKGVVDAIEIQEVKGKPRGFNAARFRPVVERKTDISIFQAMLNPSDERVMS